MLEKIESKDRSFKVKVIKDYCDTITCKQVRSPNAGVIRLDDGRYSYLTERECWRLQGYTDEDFDNAERVNPGKEGCMNGVLYKQAGNSIPVPIFESIFRKIILNQTDMSNKGNKLF